MSDKILALDDLPFNLDEQETGLFIKKLPENISAIGKQWGFCDTVFRDKVFEYIVTEILHFKSIEEYYNSDVFKKYQEKGEVLSNSILLGEYKRFKIMFNATFYDKEMNESLPHHGDFESVSIDYNTAKKNAFFELAKLVFKKGIAVKKLEITEIKKI